MFLDTSGLLCLDFPSEPFHAESLAHYRRASLCLTHSYVLAELVAVATSRRLSRIAVLRFIEALLDNPGVETIWVEQSLHREALDLLKARADKSYSLCDAVSFVVMRQWRVSEALTTDRHFEQEGCQRLLVGRT